MAKCVALKQKVEELPDFDNVVIMSNGGIGKNIAATAIVATIKEKYPNKKIIVVASHTDVWMYHPHVHRVYNFNNALNLYDDYFNDSLILGNEPYLEYGYATKKEHIIEAYGSLWDFDKPELKPVVHFLKREIEAAKKFLNNGCDEPTKKAILFQWAGGWLAPHQQCNCEESDIEARFNVGQMMGFRRSLPRETAQEIVDLLVKENFAIFEVKIPELQKLDNTLDISTPPRGIIALMPHIRSFIGIDSFLQHASAITKKRGLVLWGGTSSKCLGYSHNDNYSLGDCCPTPHCHRPNTYFFDNQGGYNWNCQYDEPCLDFDANTVVKRFLDLLKEKEGEEEK